MRLFTKYFKENTGAVQVVEMALILPIVISVLFFLITISLSVGYYLSCYSKANNIMTKEIEQAEIGEKKENQNNKLDYVLKKDKGFFSEKITVDVSRGVFKDAAYGKAIKASQVVDQMNFSQELFDKYLSNNKPGKIKQRIEETKNKVIRNEN